MDTSTGPELRGGFRTAQDACATLVELTRALKGWCFYEPGSAARADLIDRSWRVFRGEIDRNGALVLQVRRATFWLDGTEVPVGVGRLDELARRLQERGVGRIAFDAELEPAALEALLDALAADATEVVTAGGFEPVYFARPRRGIDVNEISWRRFARPLAAGITPKPDITVPDLDPAPVEPGPAALASAEPEPEPGSPASAEPEPELLSLETDADGGPLPLDLLDEIDAAEPTDGPAAESGAAPGEPAPRGALDELLRELDECDDDGRYRDTARQLAFATEAVVEQARFDESYRVLDRLAAHAGDDAKRSFAQRESARECLAHLAQRAALADLVRRSCDPDTDASLRAVGILRELGARAAPRLLDEIEREAAESERRARLASALFALGEEAAPAISDAVLSGSPRRQHAAVRLAGESQNPRLVPCLRDALVAGSGEASREAAHALGRIGDVSALEVLCEALESPRASVVALAAQALATSGRAIAVAPLAAALDRAIAARETTLARDLVRALGRLARAEAAPVLAELLDRGGFFEKRRLRDLKVAAIHALAHVPGRAADEALARAEKHGDAQQREAAALARRRRAHESARAKA